MKSDGDALAPEVSARLTAAGYVLEDNGDTWRHAETNRMLHAQVAGILTPEQLMHWIEAGDGYVG